MQHLSCGHLSISAISQLLLARFGSNFKQRVLETYTTDYNCHHNICPGKICAGAICPYQQYLSCYWPNLDQILNKGSWEYIQQITTVTTTFVRQHLSWGHMSISAISKLLLAWFCSNLKQRVLGTYTTDYNCHHDICPGNICPGDTCPYQQYTYFQAKHFRFQSCFIYPPTPHLWKEKESFSWSGRRKLKIDSR